MPLAALDTFEADLRCPRCGQELRAACCLNCGAKYERSKLLPVLIDFDRSIVEISQIAGGAVSQIARTTRRRWLERRNPVAERNISRLLATVQRKPPLVLIVGGGSIGKGLDQLYTDASIVAFDIYASPHVQLLADAHHMPFRDEVFDAVVIQAVLEHVLDPARVVAEIWRVLRPHGVVYAETPFMQQVHEGPYDFFRFTESGHRWLFRRFDLVDSGVVAGPANTLVWAVDYLARGLLRSQRIGAWTRRATLPMRFLDRLIPLEFQVDAASGVFFLGAKRDSEMNPSEIIGHYKGAQRSKPRTG